MLSVSKIKGHLAGTITQFKISLNQNWSQTHLTGKSSTHFKDIYKLKLLTNFDVNMASFLGGVPNYVSNL